MANRISNRLSAKFVETISEPGKYLDGDGLYLQVTDGARGTSKSWLFRYQLHKRTREMGFGSLKDVSLQIARKMRADARKLLLDGKDPLYEKNLQKTRDIPSFGQCCETYVDLKKSDWKNPKSELQWRNSLKNDAKLMYDIKVDNITTPIIHRVLRPIWDKKNVSANRLRGRIERVMDYAKSMGYRSGDNPASMKGNLEYSLSKKAKKTQHQPSLYWKELPVFITELRSTTAISRLALEFLILTASRTNEVINAQWNEINLEGKMWLIPASRMKMGKEHAIPLSPSAIAVLKRVKGLHERWVFPNEKRKAPLSNMAMLELVRDMEGYKDKVSKKPIVVHGFRATFRTWAAEATNFPSQIAEAALAHGNPHKAEASYIRSNQYQNRIHLMNSYALLAEGSLNTSNIIDFGSQNLKIVQA